jgi:hypothetical protein
MGMYFAIYLPSYDIGSFEKFENVFMYYQDNYNETRDLQKVAGVEMLPD